MRDGELCYLKAMAVLELQIQWARDVAGTIGWGKRVTSNTQQTGEAVAIS